MMRWVSRVFLFFLIFVIDTFEWGYYDMRKVIVVSI